MEEEKQPQKEDKLDILIKKWQFESREELKRKGSKEFDFLGSAPQGLMERVKDHTRSFVEDQWVTQSLWARTMAVLRQFKVYKNQMNEKLKDQPSFILKTRRVQYVLEKIRTQGEPLTVADFAETQMVNEVRFWATKYVILSWLAGINVTFLAYHFGLKNLKKYIGIPLTIATFFLTRNLTMRNCMDKVYYPLEPVYLRLRGDDKQKETSLKEGIKSLCFIYASKLCLQKIIKNIK